MQFVKCVRSLRSAVCAPIRAPLLALVVASALPAATAGAKGKSHSPVVGVITEGVAERLHGPGKSKKGKRGGPVGKVFTAVCDGSVGAWKVSDVGDDGAWVGAFVGGNKGRHCLLLDAAPLAVSSKSRPGATTAQLNAAKAAATTALTPKSGDPPKVEISVFHDGEDLVAVAQASRAAGGKGNCLDRTSLVILALSTEGAGGWKPMFRPGGKGKDICGYTYFTHADVDGDGRDEIALRVDRGDGYGYRVLKRVKGSYSVVAK